MSRPPAPPPKKSPINLDDQTKKEDELGTLIVVLLKAQNLPDRHSFRKSDVFAQATLNGAQKRTHVDIKGGQRPEWDAEVRFKIMKNSAEKFRKLEVECYSQEPRTEELMGKGVVDISETIRTGEFDDWVPLEVDGVRRGEIYLEMTYYANAPAPVPQQAPASAPNKMLSSVMNQNGANLTRRPSKLSPADRLSRPQPVGRPQPATQPMNIPLTPGYGAAPSRPSGLSHQRHSSSGLEDTIPGAYPIKSDYSPSHSPHSGTSPSQRPPATLTAGLPSSLRPGSAAPPGSRPQQIRHTSDPRHPQQSGTSPPRAPADLAQNPYISSSPSSKTNVNPNPNPNPYISSTAAGSSLHPPSLAPARAYSPAPSANSPAVSAGQPYLAQGLRPAEQRPTGTPILWQDDGRFGPPAQSNGTFHFPTPLAPQPVSGQRQDVPNSHYPSQYSATSPHDRADPYLQARYQTPLPLPPGADRPAPAPATVTSAPSSGHNTPPPYTPVPTPPRQTHTPLPDSNHLERLRRAEEAAAERRAQEQRDLELALQLDRELNL